MKQVQIKTDKSTIVVVDLPEDILHALIENKEFIVSYTRGYAQIYTSPTDITSTNYGAVKSLINLGILECDGGNFDLRTRNYQFNSQNFRIAGTPSQLTEEYWKGIVEEFEISDIEDHRFEVCYPDYLDDDETAFHTSTESGLSLLKANGVVMENPIKLQHDLEYMSSRWTYYSHEVLAYRKAQEQVWLNPHVFVKID